MRRGRYKTYDARTGFKVRGNKLREDGDRHGLYTTDVDPPHPQRFPVTPGPDNNYVFQPGVASPQGIPVNIKLTDRGAWVMTFGGDTRITVETT